MVPTLSHELNLHQYICLFNFVHIDTFLSKEVCWLNCRIAFVLVSKFEFHRIFMCRLILIQTFCFIKMKNISWLTTSLLIYCSKNLQNHFMHFNCTAMYYLPGKAACWEKIELQSKHR